MFRKEYSDRKSDVALKRLLYALECARSRLAVAMAAESKAIPPVTWRRYVEVEDRMRRCLKRLRLRHRALPQESLGWLPGLEALQSLPGGGNAERKQGEAQHLCQYLGDLLSRIEAQETVSQSSDLPQR